MNSGAFCILFVILGFSSSLLAEIGSADYPAQPSSGRSLSGANSTRQPLDRNATRASLGLNQRLLKAVELGDLGKVRRLIQLGASPNARSSNGETALMMATRPLSTPLDKQSSGFMLDWDGLFPILTLLLSKGAQVNATDNIGRSPLIVAAAERNMKAVDALLTQGARINHKDSYLAATPLIWAGVVDDTMMMMHLVRRGADVNLAHKGGITPLMIAVNAMRIDATSQHDRTLIQLLLDKGADVNAKDKSGKTVLMWAVDGFHNSGFLHTLIKRGANIHARDKMDQTALMVAASVGNVPAVRTLLESGAEVNAEDGGGSTALSQAAFNLPNWSFYPNWSDPSGMDEKRRIETMKLLLRYGADPTTQEDISGEYGGWTPLIYAAMKNNLIAARLLLDHGADVNAANAWGMTALAAMCNDSFPPSIALAKLLLARGANVNKQDSSGETPLMSAVSHGHVSLIKVLIRGGANPHLRDKRGRTALTLAKDERNSQLLRLLTLSGKEGQ